MIQEHFSDEKMNRILSVMPDYMVVYKVVQVESIPITSHIIEGFMFGRYNHRNLLLEIESLGKKVEYTTYPRRVKLRPGMNETSEPGFHALVKFDAAFEWYSDSSRHQIEMNFESSLGAGSKPWLGQSHGFVYETRILKCGVRKDWILGIGKEPGGELAVRCSNMLVPQYPFVDIKECGDQRYAKHKKINSASSGHNPEQFWNHEGPRIQMSTFSARDFHSPIETYEPVMAEINS